MTYRMLLKNNKTFRLLAIIQFISYFGAWFSQVGVFTLLTKELGAPANIIGFSAIFVFLPSIILAPINGVIVDRFKPKNLLMSMIIIEMFSIFMLIFVNSLAMLWFLYLLTFIRMAVASMYFQTEMSVLPKILTPQELKLGNELHSIIWAVSYALGMGIAGLFIDLFGVKPAFITDTLMLFCAMLILKVIILPNEKNTTQNNILVLIKEGLIYVFNNKKIIHLILLHGIVGITAYDVLITLLAEYKYANVISIPLAIGLSNAIRAISLLIGPYLLSPYINKKTLLYLYLAQGFGLMLWSCLQFNFYLAFIGLIAAGFCTSSLWSYTYTLLQNECDKKYYGRVIAYNDMVFLTFSAIIVFSTGYLFEFYKVKLSYFTFGLGICFILGAIYWQWFNKKIS
ncbi:MFS transporter [Campylobacter insulaenigrae]|uniref:MFS transporter n=1 Tax=Campylobacter insulaenigrae TaxID=260714 RepID=A0ABY3G2W7_9BACT|nr:MFS transporter [Campylobacter insulaenigrae]MCR6570168.1 MFS transporter [Campylobacter insulaenigrae]MCR6571953.1 MFS transporter [Campylobacter insulaenigrae]MCR6573211.1 MFS transporter [Campylobacter insulaenigrae]MCR6574998.1 MFS transporter [Campylobacter insulaenigrae]MCR6579901.1 MFS transporter [Campylobacter insulaenigrae]